MGTERKKLTEKQMTILSVLVMTGVLLALSGGLFYGVSLAGSLNGEIDDLGIRRDDLVRKERELPKLRKEIVSLEIEVERMVRILPNDQEIANLVKNLDEIAYGTREGSRAIKVTGFQPDEEKRVVGLRQKEEDPNAAFTAHPYLINAQGNYYEFGRFINLLENHIRFISTCAFEMTVPKDKRLASITGKFITIKIVTYTYNRGREKPPLVDGEREVPEELFVTRGFDFERKGRRDPFAVALVPLGADASVRRHRLTEEEQHRLLVAAESMLQGMKQFIITGMTDEALKNYIAIEEIYGKRFTKQQYFVRIGEVYNEAKKEIGEIKEAAAKRAIIRSETAIARMEELFEAENYAGVIALDNRVQKELTGVKAFGDELKEKIETLSMNSGKFSERAEIRLELLEAGVTVSGFVRIKKPIAILNNDNYVEEGEEAELGGVKFRVESIDVDNENMVVIYKGERITLNVSPPGDPGGVRPVLPPSEGVPSPDEGQDPGGNEEELPGPSEDVVPSAGEPWRQT